MCRGGRVASQVGCVVWSKKNIKSPANRVDEVEGSEAANRVDKVEGSEAANRVDEVE